MVGLILPGNRHLFNTAMSNENKNKQNINQFKSIKE